MKKVISLMIMLLIGVLNVSAKSVSLELCEYSKEYKAWLNLSSEEKEIHLCLICVYKKKMAYR